MAKSSVPHCVGPGCDMSDRIGATLAHEADRAIKEDYAVAKGRAEDLVDLDEPRDPAAEQADRQSADEDAFELACLGPAERKPGSGQGSGRGVSSARFSDAPQSPSTRFMRRTKS